MGANNFVTRLTKADFWEFISEHHGVRGFRDSDIGVVQLPTYDRETNPIFKVILKSTKKIGKKPEPMVFYFHNFYYEKGVLHNVFEIAFWPNKHSWRKFMANKFGVEYVDSYKNFVDEYYENERKRIERIKKDSDIEINQLVSMFA